MGRIVNNYKACGNRKKIRITKFFNKEFY